MKKLLIVTLVTLPPFGLLAQDQPPMAIITLPPQTHGQLPGEEKPDTGQIVLQGFAKIVGNFINLVQNPHDAAHVGYNVAEIVHTIVQTAIDGMRKGELSADPTEEEIIAYAQTVAKRVQLDVSKEVIKRSGK